MKYVPAKLKKLNLINENQSKVTYKRFLHDFINKDKGNHFFIVGEYGTGKTMICIEIETFFKSENKKYKFFRSKEDFNEIKQLDYNNSNLDYDYLIIDALDELPNEKILKNLFIFTSKTNIKILFTSRKTFLYEMLSEITEGNYDLTISSFTVRYNIDIFEIIPFDNKDIKKYLKINTSFSNKEIIKIMNNEIYKKLLVHPLWLMVLSSVYENIDIHENNDIWLLMKQYISQIFSKSNLKEEDIYTLFEDIALSILIGKPLNYNEIQGININDFILIEKNIGKIGLSHRIFIDYFFISKITKLIERKELTLFSILLLNDIQIELLSASLVEYGYQDILELLKLSTSINENLKMNYIGSNMYKFFEIREYNKDKLFEYIKSFDSADFSNSILEDLNFIDIDFKNADFAGSTISKCNFEKCNFEGVNFADKVGIIDIYVHKDKLGYITHDGLLQIISCKNNDSIFTTTNILNVTSLAFNNDILILGYANGDIKLYDKSVGIINEEFYSHSDKVMDIVIKNSIIASCSSDGNVMLWNKQDNKIHTVNAHNQIAHGIDICMQLDRIFSVGYDGTVVATGIRSAKILIQKKISEQSLYSVKVSPNNKIIIVAGFGGECYLLDIQTLDIIKKITGHKTSIWSVEWISNNEVAVLGWDEEIMIYNHITSVESYIKYPCYNSKVVKYEDSFFVTSALGCRLTKITVNTHEININKNLPCKKVISFINTKFNACYGLSPTRIESLKNFGASVKSPINVTKDEQFNKKNIFRTLLSFNKVDINISSFFNVLILNNNNISLNKKFLETLLNTINKKPNNIQKDNKLNLTFTKYIQRVKHVNLDKVAMIASVIGAIAAVIALF